MIAKTLLITSLLLSGQAFAQSSSNTIETSVGVNEKILEYLQTHFSASYHGEFYAVRRDTEASNKDERQIGDFRFMHNPTLIYKPADNWQFLSTAEFKFSDQPSDAAGAGYPNSFYRALFTLTRKNILTEKENGVKLDLGIGRRQFNTGSAQNLDGEFALSSYGNNRVFGTLSKNFGKADTSLFIQYLHNDYKKATASTWKHSAELLPTISIQLTDKISYLWNDDIIFNTANSKEADKAVSLSHEMNIGYVTYQWNDQFSSYYQLKYLHSEGFSNGFASQDDWLEHYTGVTYSITPKQSVTFEVGSELAHARDGRDGFSKKIAYPELALYVDLAI